MNNDDESILTRAMQVADTSAPTSSAYRPRVNIEPVVEEKPPMDSEVGLEIHALIHRAWAMEIVSKGGDPEMVDKDDIRCLRMAIRSIEAIRKRMPIT